MREPRGGEIAVMARMLAFSSLAMGRCMDRAERVLLFGALGMLLVSAGLGGAGLGGAVGGAGLLAGSGPALRAHVHAGSLGWIMLAVLAVALRMATGSCGSPGSRAWAGRLSWLTVAVTVAFVVTDAIGPAAARAWVGAVEFAVIVAFAAWLGWLKREAAAVRQDGDGGAQARAPGRVSWSVSNLGIGAVLAVLLAGSALGSLAAGAPVVGNGASASLVDAHSATLSVPFVVLAATSVLEWAVLEAGREDGGDGAPPTTAGLVQVGALALAAAALIAGVLTRNLALVEANVPLELGGIAIFAVRVGPSLLTSGRARPESAAEASGPGTPAIVGRAWLVIAAVALAVDVGLVAHLVFEVGQRRYVTAAMIPNWLPFAVDHVTFVAVGTASLFGAIAAMAGHPERARWARAHSDRADTLAAAGLMAGLVGSTIGIGVGSPVLGWTSSAALGLAVLGAVAVAATRVAALKPTARLSHL